MISHGLGVFAFLDPIARGRAVERAESNAVTLAVINPKRQQRKEANPIQGVEPFDALGVWTDVVSLPEITLCIRSSAPFRMRLAGACSKESKSRKEVNEMKEALALIGAVCVLAYVCVQALLAALQPLLVALSGHAH